MARCSGTCMKAWGRKNLFLIATTVAILLGITLGLSLRYVDLSLDGLIWIKIWGEIFMRLLKMLILPMVVACLIVGVSSLEGNASGRIGLGTLVYVFSTQILGVVTGFIFAIAIHPGFLLGDQVLPPQESTKLSDVFSDFLRNFFPDNIIRACLQSTFTLRENATKTVMELNANTSSVVMKEVAVQNYRDGMNTLGVVVVSLMIGIGIQMAGPKAKPLADFFDALNVVVFKLVDIVMWYSPIGIMSLIAGSLAEVDNLTSTVEAVGMYLMTVILGLVFYEVFILPLIYVVVFRKNPLPFFFQALEAVLAGGASSSSALGLPYLLRASDENWNIDRKVANFCLPIFAQINRDGSVLFMAVCMTFIAQTYGVTIAAGQYFLIGLLMTLLSVTLVAVPSSSIVVIIMISSVINVPVADRIGLIMAVEWLLDRLRVTANIASMAVGVAVIDHVLKPKSDKAEVDVENQEEGHEAMLNNGVKL